MYASMPRVISTAYSSNMTIGNAYLSTGALNEFIRDSNGKVYAVRMAKPKGMSMRVLVLGY